MDSERGAVIVTYDRLAEVLPTVESKLDTEPVSDDPQDSVRLKAAFAQVRLTLRDAEGHPDVLVSPNDPLTARFQSFVAERARTEGKLEPLPAGGLEAKYDTHDLLGWLIRFPLEWLGGRRRRPFRAIPEVEALPDRARLALFSDWGTGRYGAPHIQASIDADGTPYDYVVHLGDVYYAGTSSEYEHNFLHFWPKRDGAIGRALNGNHEMYSGGRGYFDHALPKLGQPSSVFALQNDHWLVVGLDSAYKDFDLGQGQAEWLQGLLANAGDRKLVLLSHHQLYSNTGGSQGKNLRKRLSKLLDARRIFAWYWGHEHVCAIYDEHPQWGLRGRCIGHGGIPEFRHSVDGYSAVETVGANTWYRVDPPADRGEPSPSCLFLDGPNPFIDGHADEYLPHGYVTVQLDGPRLVEEFRDPKGTVLRTTELE